MNRIPQRVDDQKSSHAWRPQVLPADYSDDVSDEELETLRKISEKEMADEEFEVVEGPAW